MTAGDCRYLGINRVHYTRDARVPTALLLRTADIASALLGKPNFRLSNKRELRFGRKGSLAVAIAGARAGSWFDHENGVGGDLLSLIPRIIGGGFLDAIEYAERFIDAELPRRTLCASGVRTKFPEDNFPYERWYAIALWREALPIADTIAMRYLRRRGILHLPPDIDTAVLRFHPFCPFDGRRHQCLLALMRDVRTNEPRAVQRTALTPTGEKIRRLMLGPKNGAAIKLSSDVDVTIGLTIGEGLETVLSAMQLGFSPAWALGDANNIRRFAVLSGIESLTIIVDNDESGTGQRVALECSSRWTSAGREVFRVIPDRCGDDFNDIVQRTVA